MKLIKPYFEIIEQRPGIEGIYKIIEQAGRTCYKSEDKITETSAKAFTDRIIKSGHLAVIEHGTVYLRILANYIDRSEKYDIPIMCDKVLKYQTNKYSKVIIKADSNKNEWAYITTNFRTLIENNWLDDLKYLCEPTEYHEKRACVRFICDRGVSHEYVRHKILCAA